MTCPGPMHPNGTMEPETCVPHGQHCPVPCGGPMGMPCPGYGSPSPASTTATMTTTMLWGAKCAPMEVECPGHLLPDATFGPSTCVPMGMPCPEYGAPASYPPPGVPGYPPAGYPPHPGYAPPPAHGYGPPPAHGYEPPPAHGYGDVPPPVPPSDTPPTPPSDMPNDGTCKKDFCDSQYPIMGKGTVCSFPDCKACAECTPGDVPPPVPPSDAPPTSPSDMPNDGNCKKDFCDSQYPIMGKGTVCSF